MSNSICAHSKGGQRSSNEAHQQDVRVCLWLSVSAGGWGGVGVSRIDHSPLWQCQLITVASRSPSYEHINIRNQRLLVDPGIS